MHKTLKRLQFRPPLPDGARPPGPPAPAAMGKPTAAAGA